MIVLVAYRGQEFVHLAVAGHNTAWACEPDVQPRSCTRVLWVKPGDEYGVCGERATRHALFEWADRGQLCGYACAAHAEALLAAELPGLHLLGDDCGMPGARWVAGDPSRCESDGIPVSEECEDRFEQLAAQSPAPNVLRCAAMAREHDLHLRVNADELAALQAAAAADGRTVSDWARRRLLSIARSPVRVVGPPRARSAAGDDLEGRGEAQ